MKPTEMDPQIEGRGFSRKQYPTAADAARAATQAAVKLKAHKDEAHHAIPGHPATGTAHAPAGAGDELMALLARSTLMPQEKTEWPVTASQDLGWHWKEARPQKWRFPRNRCADTRYAEAYASMSGVSPYANIKGGAMPGGAGAAKKAH